MQLFVLGVNYTTAPLAVRERIGIVESELTGFLQSAMGSGQLKGVIVVSTCNRTELYGQAEDISAVERWWVHGSGLENLSDYVYCHCGEQAVEHLMQVACGLDSLVLGEPQILGQLKAAFSVAQQAEVTTPVLERLFQHSFSAAKRVRTETAVGACPVSVAFTAVRLSQKMFSNLEATTVLVIGAGDTAQLVARHLKQYGVGRLIIANRTLAHAQMLAEKVAGEAISLTDLPVCLPAANIIVTATASREPIISRAMVEQAHALRDHDDPTLMVDLAVPRDISAAVADCKSVYLYTVDDLQQVIQESKKNRKQAALAAQALIHEEKDKFHAWYRSLHVSDVISDYRGQVLEVRDVLVAEALSALKNGQLAEHVVETLGHRLVNKVMHTPSVRLREAARDGRHELVSYASELLGVDKKDRIL
ncbi:Glutamyl-tRNA reductase [Piscirickettsia salmonis]|uniref:Glutamyl-tRNA reductase n=1 Tax=Piscirickettsia salmonis TaxID=1238 RepID=A0A1L6TDJ6_PISSA|nr:glutamyl-tRNA reductase [Piscirickettsia salmonis]AKP74529.1 glutamyl-tRNA reductase [Piscirickettsia salmonis LF-89 = ATCC VR-1361]ALB23510.1 glutamyl-tRNA reductase [Piscirickettsia salmonis]ALY03383.1 glutamyl-tRNA reductase [Piscirickettsia salmonis]AOS35417.1 glutamyl-tRNA reductase [Piscirickettsia salmonis]APS60122.1 glutamyl-tRNA reductase [Piscirickettsia salmonis]